LEVSTPKIDMDCRNLLLVNIVAVTRLIRFYGFIGVLQIRKI